LEALFKTLLPKDPRARLLREELDEEGGLFLVLWTKQAGSERANYSNGSLSQGNSQKPIAGASPTPAVPHWKDVGG